MASQGQGGEGKNDEGKYLIILMVVVALGWVVWVVLKAQFIWVLFGIDLVQYKALNMMRLLDARGGRWMSYVSDVWNASMLTEVQGGNYAPAKITWDAVVAVQEDIGARLRWLWIAAGLSMSMLVLFRMPGDAFKTQWSLTGRSRKEVFKFLGLRVDNKMFQFILRMIPFGGRFGMITRKKEWVNTGASFALYQARHWREALTGALFDPDAGELSMRPSLTPPEWMKENNIGLKDGKLEQMDAIRTLRLQTGENWNGLEKAPLHVQAIMIMSALNVENDERNLKALRATLAECYTLRLKSVDTEVPKLLAPFLANKTMVQRINKKASRHAFVNTACVAIYGWGGPIDAWGGKGSVLSSSLFLWVKRVDRTLWYALNNVGRRQFHIEGAGVICHFFVERLHKKSVSDVNVDNALEGVIKYLNDYYITDLDEYFLDDEDM